MSGDNGGQAVEEQLEKKPIQIIITFIPCEKFEVQAPGDKVMYDEPLSLWLLDKAKDHIKFQNIKSSQTLPKIVQPNPSMAAQVRNGLFGKRR